MNRVQLLKPVTTCVVLTMLHASNALAAPGQEPVAAQTPPPPQATAADHSKPRHAARVYLDQAKSMLDAVPEENLDHDARKLVSVLRKDFSALTDSYGANAKTDREEARETINGNVAGAVDWHARFSDVERRLAEILGGGSSFSPSYTPSGPFASGVATATSAPATQRKAASSPASATLVAPSTSPATTVVSPAVPAGEVAQVPSAGAAGATPPAVTTTPAPDPSISPQNPAASAADVAAAAATTTPPGAPVGVGSVAPAATATAGGTVAGNTGAGAAAVASVLVSTIGLKNLDPAVRMQLEQFRTTVELFFDATTRLGS